jgi:hypothetical protein
MAPPLLKAVLVRVNFGFFASPAAFAERERANVSKGISLRMGVPFGRSKYTETK